jgi:hypothetical protein
MPGNACQRPSSAGGGMAARPECQFSRANGPPSAARETSKLPLGFSIIMYIFRFCRVIDGTDHRGTVLPMGACCLRRATVARAAD